MRVLIADDEAGIIRALSRCLVNWGYEVLTAPDGLEAWKILSQPNAPRIVILDWDMPGLSGVKVCRMLRESPEGDSAYVLMLTARQQKTDLLEALEAGADDFISKPFELRELQLRLAKGVSMLERRTTDRRISIKPPTSARTLGGKFRLERKLADGGMASVWLGVHLSLGINVAIKLMKPQFAKTADYASFEREARAAAQLRNPHIVRVYDHGMTHDGMPYLVMEYLSGDSLWDRVMRDGPLAPDAVVALMSQVAEALGEAHEKDILHRDVKPDNIILVEDATSPHGFIAKLVDFGLARPDWRAHPDEAIAGTPSYMSPEYLRGDAKASPALDLWALATTAFIAMTGTSAFDGDTLEEIVRSVCSGRVPVPSQVTPTIPESVDAWFAHACNADPAARFPTARAMADALADAWRDRRSKGPGLATPVHTLAPTEPSQSPFIAATEKTDPEIREG